MAEVAAKAAGESRSPHSPCRTCRRNAQFPRSNMLNFHEVSVMYLWYHELNHSKVLREMLPACNIPSRSQGHHHHNRHRRCRSKYSRRRIGKVAMKVARGPYRRVGPKLVHTHLVRQRSCFVFFHVTYWSLATGFSLNWAQAIPHAAM